MATTALVNDIQTSSVAPSVFNIQYPNCRTGMFSLREPFQDVSAEFSSIEDRRLPIDNLSGAERQLSDFHTNQVSHTREKPLQNSSTLSKKISKRNAEVQCSLLKPYNCYDIAVQTKSPRQQLSIHDFHDRDNHIRPRYLHPKKLESVEKHQELYEILDIDSPLLQIMPKTRRIKRKEQPTTYTKTRKSIIDYNEYVEDEELSNGDDDDERIIYACQPRQTIRKTYLPPNVHMICVREDRK